MTAELIGAAIFLSFWPITAAAVCLALLLRLTESASPALRYVAATATLLTAPLLFAAALRPAGAAGALPLAVPEWHRPAGLLWLAGVALLSLRMAGGWLYLRLLIRRATPIEWPSFESLRRQLGVRRKVELRASHRGDSPFTAGWRKPVIVLPIAVLTGLPAEQLEAIILHELAHIRRMDYAMEWVLQALETAFFYHPAIWWMTAMARQERERSCDDMALEAGANRTAYAKALVELEALRTPAPAPGWTGTDIGARVGRILGMRQRTAVWPVVLLAALGLIGQVQSAWQKWVDEDVAYIIEPAEKKAFLSLRDDAERAKFVEQFWSRRDPTPGTEKNERKVEHYRRISYANERFKAPQAPGWKSDRGRMYIRFGPPDEIESHPVQGKEQWLYHYLEGIGKNVIMEFVDRDRSGVYRMTTDPNAKPPAK